MTLVEQVEMKVFKHLSLFEPETVGWPHDPVWLSLCLLHHRLGFEKELCIRCHSMWLFIIGLSHPSDFLPSNHPSVHPFIHPLFLLMCVFSKIFVCSPLILLAASVLLPLPSGILSGKQQLLNICGLAFCKILPWHVHELWFYCANPELIMVFSSNFYHLDAWG